MDAVIKVFLVLVVLSAVVAVDNREYSQLVDKDTRHPEASLQTFNSKTSQVSHDCTSNRCFRQPHLILPHHRRRHSASSEEHSLRKVHKRRKRKRNVWSRLTYQVPENSPPGTIVGEVRATDAETAEHSGIEYSIVGGPDASLFTLNHRPGGISELVTKAVMDYEASKKIYSIKIRATSSHLKTVDVDVDIYVTDVNDNAPVLSDFWIIFNNYKFAEFPSGVIGRVPVFDADLQDKLTFKFTSGNNANLLHLNESSGDLKMSPSLNTNVPTRAVFEVTVSDGLNEVSAQCQLITNIVTDVMLQNSVTIGLQNLRENDFSSFMFDKFIEVIAAAIPTSKESIVVFSIKEDSSALNISFSVRRQEDRDIDSFYSRQLIQERLYLSRSLLAKSIGLNVMPFDDNLCSREPCLNFEECVSSLKFDRAGDFISSRSLLFRSIFPIKTFSCKCPLGYSGMQHKYECDVEVNLCYSNPCENEGKCERRESGFTCICKEGFTGKMCEINLHRDTCTPGICHGSSYCLPSSSSNAIHCANCSFREWSTETCDLTTRSFSKGSYITFHSLNRRNRFTVSLKFATKQDNSLLFYNGRFNDLFDFIALEIINSRLVFSYSLGDKTARVSVCPPTGHLLDGQWHEVTVSYFNRTVNLNLDDCDDGVGENRKVAGGMFYCSNKTRLLLDKRCEDRMQSCFRFLDLNGPFLVGGLPSLPTKFSTSTNSFTGCIKDLAIDHEMLDMNDFVANNGTRSGCLEKRGFCHSFPCQNKGRCREGWNSFECECPEGYMGHDCSLSVDDVKSFRGNGLLVVTPTLAPVKSNWIVQFSFKTFQENALLATVNLDKSGMQNRVRFDVYDGHVRYTHNNESVTVTGLNVNDGKWHRVKATRSKVWMINGVWIDVDYGQHEVHRDLSTDVNGMCISKISVGGLESPEDGLEPEDDGNNFVGCIEGLDIGSGGSVWLNPTKERNVTNSCSFTDHCISNPCPKNSDCIDEGLGRYTCKCHSSYVGESCLLACELSACAHGSTCIPWNNSRGYKCICDELHFGTYCQESLSQVCPSSWWGSPVCGPCQCDVEKGYDANCNKTSGACSCQANHYQPEGSDTCYPCQCYTVGSFSNRCDHLTGQCRCRPGVIGRRCDSCASPFAEVTVNGCEVTYDGCPQSFHEEILWERTAFGQSATQKCPPHSTGNASRFCHETLGWQEADLFFCLSHSFQELNNYLDVIEADESKLKSEMVIKLSSDLRQSLKSSKRLHGRDIFVAFKLIHSLVNHESNQSGLNLTHKQERHFIPSIIDSASYILDSLHTETWNSIRKHYDDGPESFIQLFKSYLEVLIRNREDTFTEPFEVSTSHLIFGIDTISTDQLWEMNYLESFLDRSKTDITTAASPYLDFSYPDDVGVSVSLPKYNNYPPAILFREDTTRLLLPLKTVQIPTAVEAFNLNPHLYSRKNILKPTAVIGYTIFQSLSQLLPDSFDYITVRNRETFPTRANSPVFLTVLRATNSSESVEKAQPKISYRFRVLNPRGHSNPRCAYWTFDSRKSSSGRVKGKWSAKGCEFKGSYPTNRLISTFEYINCTCDKIAPVAVLMDVTGPQALFQENAQQSLISYLGLTFATTILLTALFILTVILGRSTNSNDIHRNIVLCLLMANLLFLVALKFKDELMQMEFSCKMVAILLHFFHVCIFSWMLVEGIHLQRMITEIRDINHGPMKFYYFIGYAVPAVIVGLSAGVKADLYGNYFFCWLSTSETIIWSMIGPIAVFASLNVLVFVSAVINSMNVKEAVSDYGNLKTLLLLNILLLPLLVSNWGLALLTVNDFLDGVYAAYYIVAVVTALVVFVGYCIINRRVRFSLRMTWWKLMGKEVSPDESLSVTRVSLASRNQFASPFEIHRPPRSLGVTSSSTTSRSTTTKGSSAQYYDSRYHHHHHHHHHRRRHKRRHCKHRYQPSSLGESNPSLELASSHSSDCDEGNSVAPTQNQINSVIQRNLHSSWVRESQEDIAVQEQEEQDRSEETRDDLSPYGTLAGRMRSNILALSLGEEVLRSETGQEIYSSSRSSSSKVNNNNMTDTGIPSSSYLMTQRPVLLGSVSHDIHHSDDDDPRDDSKGIEQKQHPNQEDDERRATEVITSATSEQNTSKEDRAGREEEEEEEGTASEGRKRAEASSIISSLIPPLTAIDLTSDSESDPTDFF